MLPSVRHRIDVQISVSETYCDIVFKIDIKGRQKVVVFISSYWSGASPMLLCR